MWWSTRPGLWSAKPSDRFAPIAQPGPPLTAPRQSRLMPALFILTGRLVHRDTQVILRTPPARAQAYPQRCPHPGATIARDDRITRMHRDAPPLIIAPRSEER